MKEFIITLISVALLSGGFCMLAPEGDLRKYVRLMGALCLVCAIAVPTFTAIRSDGIGLDGLLSADVENESGYEEIYGEALLRGAEETLERILKERAVGELGLKADEIDFDIDLCIDDGVYRVGAVTAYIYGGGIFTDPRKITELVNGQCGCACTVIYE